MAQRGSWLEALEQSVWALLVVVGYPVALGYIALSPPDNLGRLGDDATYHVWAVGFALLMFAIAWFAARLGAPTALRWVGLAYAAVFSFLALAFTLNEVRFTLALWDLEPELTVVLLGGVGWWLGFANLLRRRPAAGTSVPDDD